MIRMKSWSLWIVLSMAVISCTPEKREHLPPEVMESLLLDIQMADVYSVMTQPDSVTVNARNMDSLAQFYAGILKHHHITGEAFRSSMEWYEEHPKELEEIYNRIIVKLMAEAGRKEE